MALADSWMRARWSSVRNGAGRLLDQLLVAALQRAVAGADDDHVAVGVGEHLRLDVPRLVQEALDEALAAAEGRHGLADGGVEQLGDLLHGAGHLEPATATAERGLDGDGEAVLLREGDDLVGAADRVLRAGHQGGAGLHGDVPRGHLVAEVDDRLRRGADPGQPGVDDGLGEVGVLGEEAVAGVDRVRAGLLGGVQDLVDDQVGVAGGRAAEGERLVGDAHVQRVAVRLGVDGHAGETGVLARARHSHRDLTAVGDQDLLHRALLLLWTGRTVITGWNGVQRRHRSVMARPRLASWVRSTVRDSPTTAAGSPSTLRTKGAPRPSRVKAPATASGSPVAR